MTSEASLFGKVDNLLSGARAFLHQTASNRIKPPFYGLIWLLGLGT